VLNIEPEVPDQEDLRALVTARMPFGKYQDQLLVDLPEAYLVWFRQREWPRGRLGRQLALVFEAQQAGVIDGLRRLAHGETARRGG
jgi:uncharacterized protein (DUF3820 family)